jgi:hypothetical protein
MASSKQTKKYARIYVGVSTVAFSAWLVVVACRLVILAGHFVTSAVSTVIHSIPVLG